MKTIKKTGGKPAWEIVYEATEDINFIDFIDDPLLKKIIRNNSFDPITYDLIASIASISESLDNQYSLCDGTELLKFFKKLLKEFGIDEDITLGELYKKTGNHLVLVSCSLSYGKTAYFDYKTAADLPVVDAMRASMAIPFMFKPVKYNNDFFIDGGAANNYPIEYFDKISLDSKIKPVVLGIMLFSKNEMILPKWKMLDGVPAYLKAVSNITLFNTGYSLYGYNVDRTVFIDCGEVGVMSFDINKKQTRNLMQAGYDAIEKYYSKHTENTNKDIRKNEQSTKKDESPDNKNNPLSKVTENKEISPESSWYVIYPEITSLTSKIDNLYGVNLGFPFSNTTNCYGIGFGLILNNAKNVYGFQVSPATNCKNLEGISISLIGNVHNLLNGMQLGIVNNVNNKLNSNILQLGAINNVSSRLNSKALQLGVSNSVHTMPIPYIYRPDPVTISFWGLQLGLLNYANIINGVQIGICNKAKTANGIQLGLINIMDNSWLPFMPIINISL